METKLNNMNKIKFIKTQEDYQEALELMKKLILSDPEPESDEGEQLSLLNALIQDYESRSVSESLPNPVDAIKFRMEQANLKPVDLVPYIGSRSRVSEILSGKRQLTLEMVRSLEAGLGIPAKVLIKKPENVETDDEVGYNSWDNKLIAEMETHGYFGKDTVKSKSKIDLLKSFFSLVNLQPQVVGMMRKTHYRSSLLTDKKALYAWSGRVIQKANKIKIDKKYQEGSVNLEFMQNLVKLSLESNGISLVQKKLKEIGVILIIEPHLSKTYLDGATILVNKNNPVIGLTIRHDRLDNFWFTLMHELAHLALHFNQNISLFYDELIRRCKNRNR